MNEDIRQLRADFTAHANADAAFQLKMTQMFETLATKQDVQGVTDAFKIIKGNGAFVVWVGAIVLALGAIVLNWKAVLVAVLSGSIPAK